MRYLDTVSRLLLNLPYRIRLVLVGSTFFLCTVLFTLSFPARLDGSLFSIPIALGVWLFKRRGAYIALASTALVLIIGNSIVLKTMMWPTSAIITFFTGMLALLAEALVINYLRDALDIADVARVKAQQAEQQLALAYEGQKRLNQLKDQFLLNVSHELRTPLTEIIGYLELLRQYDTQLDAETANIFLNNAARGCEELQLLVNNVLDAMHIVSRNKFSAEELSVFSIMCDVLSQFEPRKKEEHSIQIDVPEHLTVWANSQYLRQVLRNLLSNALKYTPALSPILIEAMPYTANEETAVPLVRISVKDLGPGIPPDEIGLLFERFSRLSRDISGTIRGTGLGLYVSKQLVELMGGTIWVESSGIAGEGSRFCFTLPSALAQKLPTPARSEQAC
jgi:signal transduction histidine kinase